MHLNTNLVDREVTVLLQEALRILSNLQRLMTLMALALKIWSCQNLAKQNMSQKAQQYLITVNVIEGRHYVWENMDSAVIVKVGEKRHCTAVKRKTECPFYNEYFVFELMCTQEQLLDKNILITVIQPKTWCRKRKILGNVKLDVATVFAQPNCQFYHKWAVLASPKSDVISGPTGYLKLDICLLSRGQIPKLPINVSNDDIEGNLLTPVGLVSERQKAQFIFDIYNCQNLLHRRTVFEDELLPAYAKNNPPLSTKIEISFSGISGSTTVKKSSNSPEINERLIITDLFPPLCQRVKLEICFDSIKKSVHSFCHLNLKSISSDNVEGFLPTFGPSYIYMYFRHNFEDYAGAILLSLRTQLLNTEATASVGQKVTVEHGIAPLHKDTHFEFQETFLFVSIFDASHISKRIGDKPLSFRVTFGHIVTCLEKDVKDGLSEGDGNFLANSTTPRKPSRCGKHFCYMDYSDMKPCLRIVSKWPDFRKRMFNSNMLAKIARDLGRYLQNLEEIFRKTKYAYSENIDLGLKEALDYVAASGRKYCDILTNTYNFDYGTELDTERIKICLKTMNWIVEKAFIISTNKSRKFVFRKLQDIQTKIESLVEDAQSCWPDIFLWIVAGSKKIGQIKIPTRQIIYSPVDEESGEHCAKLRTLIFTPYNEPDTILAKADVMMWIGLLRQRDHCFKMLPVGYTNEGKFLKAEETKIFLCKAFIFEGEIQPGFDSSGFVDSFVQISIGNKVKETQVKKKAISPVWDQTLTFYNLKICGSREFIKNNPPAIVIEMFDLDKCYKKEFIGRVIVKPEVKFLGDSELDMQTKMKWYELRKHDVVFAELLGGFELIEVESPVMKPESDAIAPIPKEIKPSMLSYRIEILFWGVRHLKKINMIKINRPRISFYCANKFIHSETIENAKKYPNFSHTSNIHSLNVIMSTQMDYVDSFQIKLYDSRKFGVYVFAGVCQNDATSFIFTYLTLDERTSMLQNVARVSTNSLSVARSSEISIENFERSLVATKKPQTKTTSKCFEYFARLWTFFKMNHRDFKKTRTRKKGDSQYSLLPRCEDEEENEDDFDWWTKFYASIEEPDIDAQGHVPLSAKNKLKVYKNELENQPEFKGFSDMLTSFELFKGFRTGDEALDEENATATFKGAVRIYRWPPEGNEENYVTPKGILVKDGVFTGYPTNTPLDFVLRVYCIRALALRPKDHNGKSDPYIRITLGDKVINDRKNYVANNVNPTFGRLFELHASFPQHHTLYVACYDYDRGNKDDFIGETKIDLENRFYTKHRAWCGIPESYYEKGYCAWRDQRKPVEILSRICARWGLDTPVYTKCSVKIGFKEFVTPNYTLTENVEYNQQILALTALRRWQEMPLVGFKLVPEHVETRSLFSSDKPGIEQGKLQLWIDILPRQEGIPLPKIDITPRKPISYELRVIIWNTEEVTLDEDDFFTGEKKSDIYVRGFLESPDNAQYTDVHYRSLTGEGNFNWRFIFHFDYLPTESKMVIKRKDCKFSFDATEEKVPCMLNLTVWDNDTFSKDDFLGSLLMDLSKMPKGSRSSNKCNLSLTSRSARKINLFKIRRTRGWWPFKSTDKKTLKENLAGKLEAEFEVLTMEEAEKTPAGLGRQGPQQLPPPKLKNYKSKGIKICGRRFFAQYKCSKCGKKHCWKIFLLILILILVIVSFFLTLYLTGSYLFDSEGCSK